MKKQKYDEITTYLSVIQGQIYEKINLYVFGNLSENLNFLSGIQLRIPRVHIEFAILAD